MKILYLCIMRRIAFLTVLILVLFSGCKKADEQVVSGTETLVSTLHGTGPYYAFGFSFASAEKISTLSVPGPDITIFASKNVDGTIKDISLEASNFENSFSHVDEYMSEAEAVQGFNNLSTVGNTQWVASAKPLKINQVWLYKTGSGNYAKLRIISTVEEMRQSLPYGECTFQWVYQPDGSTTFLSK
ncbi:MAG: hypothetical protein ACYDEX_24915 [Mobilitalea sp.]